MAALPIAAVAALAVLVAFAGLGFSYLEALPALRERYYDGVGGRRPAGYWMWGDLAALAFSAGPLAGAGVAQLIAGGRAASATRRCGRSPRSPPRPRRPS